MSTLLRTRTKDPGASRRSGHGACPILGAMLRTPLLLAVVTGISCLSVTGSANAGQTRLAKPEAVDKAKQTLVAEAAKRHVTIRWRDAQASCKAGHFPNSFDCKLSEPRKRCKGTTQVYATGGNIKARSTKVTCTKKR